MVMPRKIALLAAAMAAPVMVSTALVLVRTRCIAITNVRNLAR